MSGAQTSRVIFLMHRQSMADEQLEEVREFATLDDFMARVEELLGGKPEETADVLIKDGEMTEELLMTAMKHGDANAAEAIKRWGDQEGRL